MSKIYIIVSKSLLDSEDNQDMVAWFSSYEKAAEYANTRWNEKSYKGVWEDKEYAGLLYYIESVPCGEED